jgi:hypothetical protein
MMFAGGVREAAAAHPSVSGMLLQSGARGTTSEGHQPRDTAPGGPGVDRSTAAGGLDAGTDAPRGPGVDAPGGPGVGGAFTSGGPGLGGAFTSGGPGLGRGSAPGAPQQAAAGRSVQRGHKRAADARDSLGGGSEEPACTQHGDQGPLQL